MAQVNIILMYQTFFLGGILESKNLAANTPGVWFCLDFLRSLELELASDLPTANTSLGTLSVTPDQKHIH